MEHASRRGTWAIVGIVVVFVLAGCGEDGDDAAATSVAKPAAAEEVVTDAPPATVTSLAEPTSGDVTTYSSAFFATPVDVVEPLWLEGAETQDTANFLTWEGAPGERAVRFMLPMSIYPPGSSSPAPVPADFVGYLSSLDEHGATLTNQSEVPVDGHPATVFTATSATELHGVLGCPEDDTPAFSCFGLGEDVALRVAIVDTDDGLLLIWLRSPAGTGANAVEEARLFDELLAGVRFADRDSEVEAAEASPLDGTYQWTLTREDALATPGQTPDDSYPWTFTVVLELGEVSMHVEYGGGSEDHKGTFEATAEQIEFVYSGRRSTYDVRQDPDGTLHLTAVGTIDPGDVYVNTAKPWTKVG